MSKLNQKGSSVLVLLIILVLFAVVGVGYYISNSQNKEGNSTAKTDDITLQDNKSTPESSPISDYVEIKEWGVKIGVGSYLDKVTIDNPENLGDDTFTINIVIKPEFSAYSDCQTGITITRVKELPSWFNSTSFNIGDYHYWSDLGFSRCDPAHANKSTNPAAVTGSQLSKEFESLGVKAI